MKRAAIYCRVSTTGQAETGTSLGTQSQECNAYARKHGYTVVEELKEDISGALLDRPGLNTIRNMVRAAALEAVIVFDPDRLARNLGHLLLLMEECDKAGVDLEFVNAENDNSPASILMLQVRGAVAQFEREKIRERSMRGKKARIEQGQIMGSGYSSFGYKYIKGEKRLELDDERAPIVRHIFDWYVNEGLTLYSIAERLSTMGVPTKNNTGYWRGSTIQVLLRNPVYKGKWAYGKRNLKVAGQPTPKLSRPSEWLYADVPPTVSAELWEAAQDRLRVNQYLGPRNSKSEYLLSGFLFCSTCGRRASGERQAGYRYYGCFRYYHAKHRPDYRCVMPLTPAGDLENTVWNELLRQILDPALIEKISGPGESARLREQILLEIATLRKAADGIQRETDRLLDLYLGEELARPVFSKRMEAINTRLEGIARQQSDAQSRLNAVENREQATQDLITYIDDIRLGLPDMPYEQRRELLIKWKVRVVYQASDDTITIEGFPLPVGPLPLTRKRKRKAPKSA